MVVSNSKYANETVIEYFRWDDEDIFVISCVPGCYLLVLWT